MAYRRKTRSKSKRKSFKAVLISAIVSFAAISVTINPQLRDNVIVAQLLDYLQVQDLDLERFNIDRFVQRGQLAPPAPAPVDGYVQTAFDQCPQFFPEQTLPAVPAGNALRELCLTPFAILHSGETKTPVFVAQRLNRRMLADARSVPRKDRFYEEARLPKEHRATLADYRGSGFSRGHMAPAGDMHNEEAMAQSFSLANMVPQDQQHNAGAWARIENDTRKYVSRARGDVYIFSGPVYESSIKTIGQGHVAVPAYLYKVVYDATTRRSWVHWHANSPGTQAGSPITYAEFVQRTGLHLLASKDGP